MGLPTALLLAKADYLVNGYDIDKNKIEQLQNNQLPFQEKGLQDLFNQAKQNFHPSNQLKPSDAFIITVPTPLTNQKTCDISYVIKATESLKPVLQDNNLIILESTVPPATTKEHVKPILDETNKKYFLSYVSEKAIPGNTIYEMQHNHRIIGGINKKSAQLTKKIYSCFVKAPIHLTDTTTAETVKLMENTFRDVNIALANELSLRLRALNINPWDAISLANHHPRVNIHLPGPGVGGHCIPIDPWFISTHKTHLINTARKINDNMPAHVFSIIQNKVKHKKQPIITIFGVAYKGNVDDPRLSPSIPLIELLKKSGYNIKIFDPHVNEFKYPLLDLNSSIENSDCIVIITDHNYFKNLHPSDIAAKMRTKNIIDTRNIVDNEKWVQSGFNITIL